MRQLILDTETTGLDPQLGHRIIEIAAVELVHRRATGRHLHFRVDPDREVDAAASEVHGMTWEDLKGKPRFHEIAAEFVEFARGAEWIIHNAPFDVAFLDNELSLAGMPRCEALYDRLTDSLELARESFPGKRNSLDALCERYGISNAHRTLHGALLDARLLADVYLAMTRGQETLIIDLAVPSAVIPVAPFGTGGMHDGGPAAARGDPADGRRARGPPRLPRGARPRVEGPLRVAGRAQPPRRPGRGVVPAPAPRSELVLQ
jgi:DNA polymerase-3 subunit epsilon